MAISFSSPAARDGRLRGAGVTAVLGPTNTGKTHLAIERMLGAFVRHDRPAAAAAGARGLQQGRRPGRRRERRADHRRGEDQAAESALLGLHRRGDAARSRSSPSSPSTRSSSAPISSAATSSPTACSTGAAARRRWCSAPPPCGRWSRSCCPAPTSCSGRGCRTLTSRRREEDHAAAAPHRHRRVLGRRGLRHRRTDPPPARRRRGGARRAVAAHAQRAGRALPVRRRRLSGRHRRHRHGAQSRRRSRRLRLRPQVRRLSVPQAQPGRAGADRRPRRPRHSATARSAPPAAARRSRTSWCSALESHSFEPVKVLQWRNTDLDFASIGALQASLAMTPTESGLTRAPIAEDILVLEHAARDEEIRAHGDEPRARSSGCGRSARFRITARSRRPRMPNLP